MLDSRQLALKLIANVTYGYTAAGFSGRMPSVEIADSVVGFGRQTIETALNLINEREGTDHTRIIYGDTDSLFVLCQGKSLQEAF
jgi:DNA polymerase zeta